MDHSGGHADEEGAGCGGTQEVNGKPPYFLFNFVVRLKLL